MNIFWSIAFIFGITVMVFGSISAIIDGDKVMLVVVFIGLIVVLVSIEMSGILYKLKKPKKRRRRKWADHK